MVEANIALFQANLEATLAIQLKACANFNFTPTISLPPINLFNKALFWLDTANKILDLINNLKDLLTQSDGDGVKKVDVTVKVFDECEEDGPKYREVTVSAIKGTESQVVRLFDEIYSISAERCEPCCIAAVPEHWQIRPEAQRPQLVIQFAQRDQETAKWGPPNLPITVPHFNESANLAGIIQTLDYRKGNRGAVLTLKDNSKVVVNASSFAVAESVIEKLKGLIKSEYLEGSFLKLGQRKGRTLSDGVVYPRIARYFPTGQQNMKPEWVKYYDLPG